MNGRRRKPDTRTRVGGRRRDTAGERARGREKALYAGQLIDARAQRRVRVEWRVRVRGCQVRFVNGARGVPGHLNLACLPSLPTPESSPDSIARIPLSLSLSCLAEFLVGSLPSTTDRRISIPRHTPKYGI